MKTKKNLSRLLALLLTFGASIILGFLSFGGMYALLPLLPLAIGAFVLSVAYEGEIYNKNIQGALDKLTRRDYLKRHLANEYLLSLFKNGIDTEARGCPLFFGHYKQQLEELAKLSGKKLDPASKARKKQVKKTLRGMEKWFAMQVFPPAGEDKTLLSDYEIELRDWLAENGQQERQNLFKLRHRQFRLTQGFSVLSGLFMGLGTTYLLVEAFATIPLLAAIPFGILPVLIVPMAIIAGAAWGLLTYNTITDMINNDTLRKWYKRIRDDLKEGLTLRNVLIVGMAVLLVSLAVALTICTAGTWWTVAKHSRPLFAWMGKMPGFIMGVINPLITGIAALSFNLENTAGSLEIVYGLLSSGHNWFSRAYESIHQSILGLLQRENWLQILNPFRLLLKVTIVPLRILLFFGHLISIGVTADRVPGIPAIVSAILGIISEGFEDMHYFVEHAHDQEEDDFNDLLEKRLNPEEAGHDHSTDLPTRILKLIFSPVYLLAAGWDYLAFRLVSAPRPTSEALTFADAWKKQTGQKIDHRAEEHIDVAVPAEQWQAQHAVYKIERYKAKHFGGLILADRSGARQKIEGLNALQQDLRHLDFRVQTPKARIEQEQEKAMYNRHRLFSHGNTSTQQLLDDLPQQISAPAA
ncbi:hypothetical protein [Legionella spiritensis]|uniref:hypothetical protein n=1 Tax=Legionella spiritensis TaxID=452 RepID=UPI000F6F7BBF|nr:hypothetical protein [Legionella spiritensis]VEG91439.1 Uncharacterised protein [Legionella spiritensis]